MIDAIQAFKRLLEGRKRAIKIYDSSLIERDGAAFFLMLEKYERKLVIIYPSGDADGLHGNFIAEEEGELNKALNYKICPCDDQNASELRKIFPFTKPRVIGLTPAIGTGDRIGLATPGHIRAVRKLGVFPVLAQQSIREMERTSRSPRDVINDVSWAVFQEGYRGGFAADADHLKTESDVEATFEAGFTMYTIDPSDYVDDEADNYALGTLREKFKSLPWGELACTKRGLLRLYLGKEFEITTGSGKESLKLVFSEEDLLRAAVKYSAAIAHTLKLKRRLDELFRGGSYDLEVSVDETSTPTKPLEHLFIALELRRLNIPIQGLALRFVGRFEKAVDYIGDLEEFEKSFRYHVMIARKFGPYKLSVHSGSDKFSIYPILGKLAGDMIHLKTAGTSYIESLRIIARRDPSLFREIVHYSIQHFEEDRRTYHISTDLSMVPDLDEVSDGELEKIYLDENPGRQVLHVTFGSVLTAKKRDGTSLFRDRIRKVLIDNEEEYYQTISKHLERHIKDLWFSNSAS